MARKKRSDSTSYVKESMRIADAGPPDPPEYVELEAHHMPFWRAIMSTKAYDMWTPNDLVVAASLARIEYEIQDYSQLVADKKRLIKENGRLNVSPLHKVLVDLESQAGALCRTLQIHARATHGESTFQKKRNKAFAEARTVVESRDDDDLIARPTH